MRVISGTVRGKKLISPENNDIRPTLDRVKEAVFNMIAFSVNGSRVLDLFAGSGALGIEALSRGAKNAVFIDSSIDSLSVAKKNVASVAFEEKSVFKHCDFRQYLDAAREAFDLIFIDPPYADGLMEEALLLIHEKNLLVPNGYIVCESDRSENFTPDNTKFDILRDKHYGRVQIHLLAMR